MSDILWTIGFYYLLLSSLATGLLLLWGWRQAKRERLRQEWRSTPIMGPVRVNVRRIL